MDVGSRLGPYEILELIGQGGMGEVFRARDTKLNRDVAIKVMPDAVAADPDRLARFRREAQVLASLNHPNIGHIYGFEDVPAGDGRPGATHALVLELVEGPTLADRIAEGRVPLAEALNIAKQIANALEAAHDQGIVHRDLKPANVKLREDGTVKVLDFGLAKAMDPAGGSSADAMASPTLTARATQLGVILGTAAYMAPEQAKAKAVDKRADIWAFGVVVYEMLTGRRAFDGEDVTEVLASVVLRDPDLSALPDDVPPPVRRLLTRCLQKDPKRRLRDLTEGMLQLEDSLGDHDAVVAGGARAASTVSTPADAAFRPLWRRALPLAGMLLLGVGGTIAVWMLWPAPVAAPEVVRFGIVPPETAQFSPTTNGQDVAVSRDGRHVIYRGPGTPPMASELNIRSLDVMDGVPLRGTADGFQPFLSPDGEWVGFTDLPARTIKKVSIHGGPSVTLSESVDNQILGLDWGANGRIVFGTVGSGLFTIPSGGGKPEAITALDSAQGETGHYWPSFLPGGRSVVFVAATAAPLATGQLAVVDLDSGKITKLGLGGSSPRYVPTGHLLFINVDASVRAVAFDAVALKLTGNPVPVLEGVSSKTSGAANFAVSESGHLVYTTGGGIGNPRTLAWVDRSGKETPVAAPPRGYVYGWVSPDGTRAALDVRDQEADIWVWDFARETLTRLTFDPGNDQYGLWTPDARHVIFSGTRDSKNGLFRRATDGTGVEERLTTSDSGSQWPNAVQPDGKRVLFRQSMPNHGDDIFAVALDGSSKPEVVIGTEHGERNAALSPDGRWLAYESNASGEVQVYVQPYPDTDTGRWQISTAGGSEPVWAPNGRELFYVAGNSLMSVPVDASSAFVPGTPGKLFDVRGYYTGSVGRNYDVAPDGKRFLMIKDTAVAEGQPQQIIHVVLNWVEDLKARVPIE